MAKILSPVLKFVRVDASITDGDSNLELEVDFRLGPSVGIELFRTEAQGVLSSFVPTSVYASSLLQVSLHRRVGTLDSPLVATNTLQTEVMHYYSLSVNGQDEAGTAGGSAGFVIEHGPKVINYKDIVPKGGGLLLVGNLTVRVQMSASTPTTTFAGVGMVGWYRYVQLTAVEVAQAFFGRQ